MPQEIAEFIQWQIKYKMFNINAKHDGETALHWASRHGYTEIVKALLAQPGIDINSETDKGGKTALIKASENGHTEIVQLLLEQKGIDINAKDRGRWTALISASFSGNTEIVQLLLEQKGIDINAKDCWGRTALMYASYKGRIEIVKLLLEQEGIDINAKDKDGWTALMKASRNGYKEIVILLLEHEKIDINAKNDIYFNNIKFHDNIWKLFKIFQTALIIASEKGYTEIVKLLLEQEKIDAKVKDIFYFNNLIFQNNIWKLFKIFKTALMHAIENNEIDVIHLFMSKSGEACTDIKKYYKS